MERIRALPFEGQALFNVEGKHYCQFHLRPKPDLVDFYRMIGELPHSNFSGVVFPGTDVNLRLTKGTEILLRNCTFEDDTRLLLPEKRIDASNAKALGTLTLHSQQTPQVILDNATIEGRLHLGNGSSTMSCRDWSFIRAQLLGGVDFSGIEFIDSLNLDRAVLSGPVIFSGTKFPQKTTAYGIVAKGKALSASCEASYREARNAFHAHRNRELEGKFFAFEKRCHRRGLPRQLRYLLPKCLSWLYDVTSEYGQSYGRALSALVASKVVFAFFYSFFSGGSKERFGLPGEIDADSIAFTFWQTVKPFETWSGKFQPMLGSYETIVADSIHTGYWMFWTTLDSIASLSLVALTVLALRWRFRRE